MSFYHIKIPRTDLIFRGSPINTPGVYKGHYAGIYQREDLQTLKIYIKEEVIAVWK